IVAADDDRWGEVGHAFVVPAPGQSPSTEELRKFLLGRLAKYKVPKYFDIVSDLPRTGSGKVHKVSLRSADPLGAHSPGCPRARPLPLTHPTSEHALHSNSYPSTPT